MQTISTNNSVGNRIRYLRKKRYVSMDQLATAINVAGKSTISNWEKGLSVPKQDNLKRLADYLNVEPDYILYGDFNTNGMNTVKNALEVYEEKRAEELSNDNYGYWSDKDNTADEFASLEAAVIGNYFEMKLAAHYNPMIKHFDIYKRVMHQFDTLTATSYSIAESKTWDEFFDDMREHGKY